MLSVRYGFTLIELLVVIVIASILSTVAYSTYISFIISSKTELVTAELAKIASDFEIYYTENGNYFGAMSSYENDDYHFRVLTCEQNPLVYRLEAHPKTGSLAYEKGTLIQDSGGDSRWVAHGHSGGRGPEGSDSWCQTVGG